MEYLVTMTTHVPEGTPPEEVDDMRAREAAHTLELAAQGRVLRLWRPPLAPGEWRTIGLFSADDADDLERTLASMPLRSWRTDEPTDLGTHPNDPGPGAVPPAADRDEYLVTFHMQIPRGAGPEEREEMNAREAARAGEAADADYLVRLWTVPGHSRNLGLWQASKPETLQEVLGALPMTEAGWLTVDLLPLTRHPNDPAGVPRTNASAGSSSAT